MGLRLICACDEASGGDEHTSTSRQRADERSRHRRIHLLSLPYDIRHLILEKVLLSPGPIRDLIPDGFCHKIKPGQLEKDHICSWPREKQTQNSHNHHHTPSIDSTILRVCRQLYHEGLPVLFQNTFQFSNIEAIEHFQGSATYAFLRPRIRHVELVSSIEAFDTPMWHRLAPISTRLQVSSMQLYRGLRDDIQPFLAAWAAAEAVRQAAFGPTRYLDTLTITFRNWNWRIPATTKTTSSEVPPVAFPDTLSSRAQQRLLHAMCAMLKRGYPAKAALCRVCGLLTNSSSSSDKDTPDTGGGGDVRLHIKYPDRDPLSSSAPQQLTQQEREDEEEYAAAWAAFEDTLRTDLLAHLHGGSAVA